MPRPVFILCAESLAQDKATNLISVFHILDGFQVFRAENAAAVAEVARSKDPASAAQLLMVGIARWMRNPGDDPEAEYEFELAVRVPGASEPKIISKGSFVFRKAMHQFMSRMKIDWAAAGTFLFISRIRKVGDTDWMYQDYPMEISVIDLSGEPSPQ